MALALPKATIHQAGVYMVYPSTNEPLRFNGQSLDTWDRPLVRAGIALVTEFVPGDTIEGAGAAILTEFPR